MARKSQQKQTYSTIKCSHCSYEYSDSLKYCPKCSESTATSKSKYRLNRFQESQHKKICAHEIAGYSVVALVLVILFLGLIAVYSFISSEPVKISLIIASAIVVPAAIIIVTVKATDLIKDKKKTKILAQFYKDNTSICPSCGCQKISFGRRGYDWNYAYWGDIFNIKGSQYIAGMNSRQVIAHCNRCGRSWNTHREWLD